MRANIELSQESISLEKEKKTISIDITTDIAYSIKNESDWINITLERDSTKNGIFYKKYKLKFKKNESETRNATVIFEITPVRTYSLRISQRGRNLGRITDSLALVALYNSTNGKDWTNNANWLSDKPIYLWYGINCTSAGMLEGTARVEAITLINNNLSGTIPKEIGNMDSLKVFSIAENKLSGEIPEEVVMRAQNSLKNNYNQGKIDRHLDYIDNRINEFEHALDQADSDEEKVELAKKIENQKERKSKYEALEVQLQSTGKDQISTTDKDAQSVVLHRHITQVGYNVQASVDAKNKLITHFDTGSVNDTNALASVAIETKEILQVEKMDVLADKGYHTGEQIRLCEENNITTYVSPKEPASNNSDIFPVTQFIYDAEKNSYTCPAGETLTTNGTLYTHSSKGYKSAYKFQRYNNVAACKICQMQSECTTSKKNGRNIDRSEFASQMGQNAERINQNKDYYKQRQQLAEHPWGTIKRQRGFDQVLTRGKTKVLGEVSLVFIGYNLVRCVNIVDGMEKFKALTNRYMSSVSRLYRLQMAYFKHFSGFNEFQLLFSVMKI